MREFIWFESRLCATCQRGRQSHWRGRFFPAFSIAGPMDWFAPDSSSTSEYRTTSSGRRGCSPRGLAQLRAIRLRPHPQGSLAIQSEEGVGIFLIGKKAAARVQDEEDAQANNADDGQVQLGCAFHHVIARVALINFGTAAWASLVNAPTGLLAREPLRRRRPISKLRVLPRRRIGLNFNP